MVDWKLMDDPANGENRNAGNGGDLVKHTVYLAVLRFLLTREPWWDGLVLRECHAGRGAYRIPDGDPRRGLLSCLHSNPAGGGPVLLHDAQRRVLSPLGRWPSASGAVQWYAGSALINACILAENHGKPHRLDLYEWMPETRQILRAALLAAGGEAQRSWSVLPEDDQGRVFDGEAHIARNIRHWGRQDVVLLDPFAMWRQPSDQGKRDCYGAIIDGLVSRGRDAPSLVLFWTWGRAFPVAEGDLEGTASPVPNGYSELRAKLHKAGLQFVLVKWRWDFSSQCGLWRPPITWRNCAVTLTPIAGHCRIT
jgi:hypothetical protein